MKHYLITGASRGIGFELTRYLLEQSHTVYALSRSTDSLQTLKQKYEQLHFLPTDISDTRSVDQVFHYLNKRSVKLDGLVNNAGLLINRPFDAMSDEEWNLQWGVNLMGPVRLIRVLLPFFNPYSHIVNISSMGGFQGASKFPGLSAYSTTKGALSILSECLAEEFVDRKISVNALCLGAVNTEMLQEAFPGFDAPVNADQMGKFIGDFLLNAHTFLNGKILPIAKNNPG